MNTTNNKTINYSHYNITNKDGKSNCVIRSFCKLYNKDYADIYNELCNIQKELKCDSYNDIPVFEKYMSNNNTYYVEDIKDIKIKDLKLDNSSYIVLCWDKNDYYHMVPIIDNVLYDKDNNSLELYILKLYKQNTND